MKLQGWPRAGLVGVVAAVSLTGVMLSDGCGLHTPSGIRIDQRTVDTAADNPDIRKLPPGPAPGASPQKIVQGFLEASAADPAHGFTQPFLTSDAKWTDRDSATVYDPDSMAELKVVTAREQATVTMIARTVGDITSGGAFTPSQRSLSAEFQLRKQDGQWRLSSVPSGLLLTPRDLDRSYRPVRAYGFDADRSLLVAEPGYVAEGRAGLAGAALHALLTGWGGHGDAARATQGLPPGLTALGSVVVNEGEATVDLGREAFTVPPSRRGLLVSQIAASLASVPGVFTVRVLVEERSYTGGAVKAALPTSLTSASRGPALAVGADGRLVTVDGTATHPVSWQLAGRPGNAPHAAEAGLLVDPVTAPGGRQLAAIRFTPQGARLVIADLRGTLPFTATERLSRPLDSGAAAQYLAPQWLDEGTLLVGAAGDQPGLQLVDAATGVTRSLPAPQLRSLGSVIEFAVSRDGSRLLAVAGPPGARQVYLARITRGADAPAPDSPQPRPATVSDWTQVPTGMADVGAVGWSGDLSITVVGVPPERRSGAVDAGATLRAELVALDSVEPPIPLPLPPAAVASSGNAGQLVQLSVAPGRPTVLSTGTAAWTLQSSQWAPLPLLRDPSYP